VNLNIFQQAWYSLTGIVWQTYRLARDFKSPLTIAGKNGCDKTPGGNTAGMMVKRGGISTDMLSQLVG